MRLSGLTSNLLSSLTFPAWAKIPSVTKIKWWHLYKSRWAESFAWRWQNSLVNSIVSQQEGPWYHISDYRKGIKWCSSDFKHMYSSWISQEGWLWPDGVRDECFLWKSHFFLLMGTKAFFKRCLCQLKYISERSWHLSSFYTKTSSRNNLRKFSFVNVCSADWLDSLWCINRGHLCCSLINATSQRRVIDPEAAVSLHATFNTWDKLLGLISPSADKSRNVTESQTRFSLLVAEMYEDS